MNKQLQDFARAELKTGLAELPEENHRTFKLMYARDNGKRSVVDAVAMPINDVVDLMPPEQLDWAMQQVQASLDKMHNDLGNRRAAFGASALTDELERLTHEDLRKWAEALDKEMPRGLGERLLRFAEAWREQVDCSNTNKA